MWLVKVPFGSTSFTWKSKILCPSASCNQGRSSAIESLDSSIIYNFIFYGNPTYMLFISLSSANGSAVGSRYISNTSGGSVFKSAIYSNYIIAMFATSSYRVFIFNTSNNTITLYDFSSFAPQSLVREPINGRIIMGGLYNSQTFYSKFYIESSLAYSDFLTTTVSFSVLNSGSYDVIRGNGISFYSATTPSVTTGSYSNLTVTYQLNSGSSIVSDARFQVSSQSYLNLIENTYTEQNPDLTCSSSGATSISYSIDSYNGTSIPSWVSIDSLGVLKITSPSVSSATTYSFYINSLISGATGNVQKLITVQVNK